MHRDVWEYHNGSIPKGYSVHHINGDPGDNRIENLECMPTGEHISLHGKENSKNKSTEQLQHLTNIRLKASEWHKSEEGRKWHRDVANKMVAEGRNNGGNYPRIARTIICCWCGGEAQKNSSKAIFCSDKCQLEESSHRRKGKPIAPSTYKRRI